MPHVGRQGGACAARRRPRACSPMLAASGEVVRARTTATGLQHTWRNTLPLGGWRHGVQGGDEIKRPCLTANTRLCIPSAIIAAKDDGSFEAIQKRLVAPRSDCIVNRGSSKGPTIAFEQVGGAASWGASERCCMRPQPVRLPTRAVGRACARTHSRVRPRPRRTHGHGPS